MDKKLTAVYEYVNGPRGLHYRRGDVFSVTDAEHAFLMADAPGCFDEYAEVVKALDVPVADKMLRAPKAKK